MPIRFPKSLEPLLVDITTVEQHPLNPNNGDTEAIAASMDVNTMFDPVGVQTSTGYIIDGNHRYAALLYHGSPTIPVVWLDVDDDEALRILIVANSLAQKAQMDAGSVLALIKDHELDDVASLMGFGLTQNDIEKMQQAVAATPMPENHGYGEPISSGMKCPACGHEW